MKFAHIADTHIRNLKYHAEYKTIFNKIYETLRKEKVDYIVHCGDICHTKTQISPEYVEMASDFLYNLAEIAPTYIILGNHDGNLRNANRQDAISPIVKSLNHANLHLLKNSCEVNLGNDFNLNVLSVFDEDNWKDPSNNDQINIALYHGSISGCQTDIGWKMDVGEHDISIFDKFDYAMLGDIHLTNQIMDQKGRIRYAGSTIQQNHGEGACKGFLIWDIEDKNKFTVRPITITNPKPFISLPLTKDGKVPEIEIPEGTRLRLVVENSISSTALKKAVDVAKKRYQLEAITVVNKATFSNGVKIDESFQKENLRDLAVQEGLIKDYLEDYKINDSLEKKIRDLNKKYKQIVENNDETYRNVDFEILELEWSNLFNYGENNRIDFTKYNGITGIYGRNFSGKSSIVDSLLFTIYNSISKNSRKNLNIINNNKTEGHGQVKIRRGNKVYTIKRESSKYLKKLKGTETVEAKTVVDFKCWDVITEKEESLNGLTRADTDKNIIKYFGTLDDFLITSMSSQLGALAFINEGSTKRKEILAKFLDLEIFDKKFKSAKEDAAEIKSEIKVLDAVDYDKEIKVVHETLINNEASTMKRKNSCETLKKGIASLKEEVSTLEDRIQTAPTEIIDIVNIRNSISLAKKNIESYKSQIIEKEKENDTNKAKVIKANRFIESFDKQALLAQKQKYSNLETELDDISLELRDKESDLAQAEKQVDLLKEVPCGSEFSHCKFIRGAYTAQGNIPLIKIGQESFREKLDTVRSSVEEIDIHGIENSLNKFESLLKMKGELERKIPTDEILIENISSKRMIIEHDLADLEDKELFYNENKEVIEDLEGIISDKDAKVTKLNNYCTELEECESELLKLYKLHGFSEHQLENLESERKKCESLKTDYEAHDLYMRCMHPNGIAYDIIKKSLPTINGEISKILANVVDFQVFFETDDKRLDIYIQQPDRDPSPLEMASGAEKTVAAMAIRLAFTNISSLPKSQLFILDEPGTALDAERMEGFIRIMDITTSIFKTVILISHLDNLKDAADSIITIEKKGSYANVTA
jgi:DNA repair exonuclease SbcCD ATPase subunit/DNA repair exonuclease SbcCD nuclease subunit|tara:strand:- start:2380 stop:5523 length:3144 start_codon:yes stop_codon:yes gene_type:complete